MTMQRSTEHQQPTRRRPSWWRRPWVAPLAMIALAFLGYSVPRYLTLDPGQSRVPSTFALHYAFLVGHVLFGSVAMLAACLQIWPRLRAKYPAVHRWSGRAYVFAGALPAGTLALIVGAASPFGPIAATGDVLLAVLWLGTTTAGYVCARRGDFAQHRRWMIRSFAMTMSIIVNRVIGIAVGLSLRPEMFHGNQLAYQQALPALTIFLTLLFSILTAELWLERDQRKLTRSRRGARAAR